MVVGLLHNSNKLGCKLQPWLNVFKMTLLKVDCEQFEMWKVFPVRFALVEQGLISQIVKTSLISSYEELLVLT